MKRFCFTSSSEVYAVSARNNLVKQPVDEKVILAIKDLGDPRDTYLLSKIFGEAMCRHSGLPFLIFRPHNIYGPRMGFSHVIPELINKIKFEKKINVFSPYHSRAFCFIDDGALGTILAMECEEASSDIFHIGSDEEITIEELVIEAGKFFNYVGNYEMADTYPGSVSRRCPDLSKAKEMLGYEVRTKWQDGLTKTLQWYSDYFLNKNPKNNIIKTKNAQRSFIVI